MQKVVLLAITVAFNAGAHAQPSQDMEITGTELDRQLFGAYNSCNLPAFGNLLAPDIEFYHDKGGLMVGRQSVVDAVEKNICDKVRRELIPGTLHSYPMENYGLVQLGEHRFCSPKTDKCEGVARFVHLWQKTDGSWHVTRIISYDHNAL
ncbi:MAG TPA: nuclear transport factor 2 family protein [Povalibacter sp.]